MMPKDNRNFYMTTTYNQLYHIKKQVLEYKYTIKNIESGKEEWEKSPCRKLKVLNPDTNKYDGTQES